MKKLLSKKTKKTKKIKKIKKEKLNELGYPVDDPYGLGAAFRRAFCGGK